MSTGDRGSGDVDVIRLALPALFSYSRVARLAVTGLASRNGFSYDDVEDLRIAIGEVFGLLSVPEGDDLRLELACRLAPDHLEVVTSRRPAAPLGDGAVEAHVQLLHAAGHPHRPALVAEVALELADDGGRGEGGELQAPVRVEAVDRAQQAQRGDLLEVVERHAPVGEAAGEVEREPQVGRHELVADGQVTGPVVGLEQDLLGFALGVVDGHVSLAAA